MSEEKRIARWLRCQLQDVPPAVRFALSHKGEDGEVETLTKSQSGKGDLSERADAIAAKIWETATHHQECFAGKQRYKLTAFTTNDENAGDDGGSDSLSFALGVDGFKVDPSEPNERGIIQALMATVRQQNQMILENAAAVSRPLQEENKALRERLSHVEQYQIEAIEVLEEVRTMKHQRDLELLRAGSDVDMRQQMFKEFRQHAPMLLKAFAGGKTEAPNGNANAGDGKAEKALPPAASPNTASVGHYQRILRDVWRVVDRGPVLACLTSAECAELDNLLGLGTDPSSVEEYRENMRKLWSKLSEEVSDALIAKLATTPALAIELTDLLEPTSKEQPNA